MKRALFPIALSVLTALLPAAAALAQSTNPVVVELYTSQGCSSCPPADELMQELATRDDVLGLALHVDYWDYIGWKDEYAKPSHTTRQQGYAQAGGRSMIYTPQMVINGLEDVVGAREAELMALIDHHRNRTPLATVETVQNGDTVEVQVVGAENLPKGIYAVQLVRYTPMRHASIKRGELAGHDLSYANVVDDLSLLGRWDGQENTSFSVRLADGMKTAVLVQVPGYGPIIAAAKLD